MPVTQSRPSNNVRFWHKADIQFKSLWASSSFPI